MNDIIDVRNDHSKVWKLCRKIENRLSFKTYLTSIYLRIFWIFSYSGRIKRLFKRVFSELLDWNTLENQWLAVQTTRLLIIGRPGDEHPVPHLNCCPNQLSFYSDKLEEKRRRINLLLSINIVYNNAIELWD